MRFLLASVLSALVASCSDAPLPAIARDLPSNARDGREVFDARVKAAYPLGTSEKQLVDTLTRDGFAVEPGASYGYRSGDIVRSDGLCQTLWSVRWKAEAGKIADIIGVFGYRCP